ncbi:MAG: hypothetical protein AAF690_07105 [Acidobacteriota bacterium]
MTALAMALERRGAFFSNPESEVQKFVIVRILFGLLLIRRSSNLLLWRFPEDVADPLMSGAMWAGLTAAVLVTVGLLTQAALVYFILVDWQIGERYLQTSTLGNDVAAMLALLLILSNAGAHLSVDRLLLRRRSVAASLLTAVYYEDGMPSKNALILAKFGGVLSFGLVCLYSLAQHLNEPAWMTGTAGPLLLTNNFMSSVPRVFESFFERGPWAVLLGRISLWLMIPWFAFFIPCVILGGWFRRYAIAWGLLFFLMSLTVLQLGSLAEFELLFFAALFWPTASTPSTERSETALLDDAIVPVFSHLALLALIYVVMLPAPFLGWNGPLGAERFKTLNRTVRRIPHIYGIAPINVFNESDLRLAENWFTLSRVSRGGGEELLPILDTDGSRLAMHASDRVYFGHTARFRRRRVGLDGCGYERERRWVNRFIDFDAATETASFVYRQYHQPLVSADEILAGRFDQPPVELVCELTLSREDLEKRRRKRGPSR